MGVLFMDTSALIKRYVPCETGSHWTRLQCVPEAGNNIILAETTLVEAVASICRKARETNPIHASVEGFVVDNPNNHP